VIFKEAHLDYIALFIFDQSLAHASLDSDACHAFNMNKFNGGKQRKQKDTIIPMNNPCAKFHGKHQTMTTDTGEAKGLKQVLKKHSIHIHRMTAKCFLVFLREWS